MKQHKSKMLIFYIFILKKHSNECTLLKSVFFMFSLNSSRQMLRRYVERRPTHLTGEVVVSLPLPPSLVTEVFNVGDGKAI